MKASLVLLAPLIGLSLGRVSNSSFVAANIPKVKNLEPISKSPENIFEKSPAYIRKPQPQPGPQPAPGIKEHPKDEIKQYLVAAGKQDIKIMVPLNKLDDSVQHSGVNSIYDEVRNTDFNPNFAYNPETITNPDGLVLKFWNGTHARQAEAWAREEKIHFPLVIVNPAEQHGVCVLASSKNLGAVPEGQLQVTQFTLNSTSSPRLYIPANQTVVIGNYVPRGDKVEYNGRLQAQFGCDSNCTKCAGDRYGPVLNLFEWAYVNDSSRNENSSAWTDISLVDGYNTNMNVTTLKDDGQICNQRVCEISQRHLKSKCPNRNLWGEWGRSGCKSECKRTGNEWDCCTGAHQSYESCRPSSMFFRDICKYAYAWAFDDRGMVDNCQEAWGMRVVVSPVS